MSDAIDYNLIIVFLSVCIVLSYFFSEISKRTNIPSVLMLIVAGVGIGQLFLLFPSFQYNFLPSLKVLGTVGLIMIVLEGALDLELSKEKRPLILKATWLALFGIIGSMGVISLLFYLLLDMPFDSAVLYSTPLAVISSAIVIPSVANLLEYDKELLIYESCLSDIFGIMIFNLVISILETSQVGVSLGEFSLEIIITVLVSLLVGVGLVLLFKFLNAKVKLFFFISILILIYSLGKMIHLSPLVLILMFGLILKNHHLFFIGPLKGLMTRIEFVKMEKDFHIVTRETAFVLRTFFFIVFGITIDLSSLLNIEVLILSLMTFITILLVRIGLLNKFAKKASKVVEYVAPRGLITVLLFYSIPDELVSSIFNQGIILWVVIITSLYMSYGLIKSGNKGELRETDASIVDV
ncbi:MAG: cation:proton antiporter [Bacteroidia bacterium]|nr:cation:proton antiporter [Bacteroidia bacterium]